MFAQATQVILSAADLINYLGCRHATFLDLTTLGQQTLPVESDPETELLKKKGIEHERRYLDYVKSQGRQVVIIDPHATIEQRVALTLAALSEGAEVIYQGALIDTPWMGYADFLIRVNAKTRLGNFGYEVVDTKLARSAQPKHAVQLCVYSKLLGMAQEQLPANIHLVLGDASQVSFPLAHFLYYAGLAQRRLRIVCGNTSLAIDCRAMWPLRVLPMERSLCERMGAHGPPKLGCQYYAHPDREVEGCGNRHRTQAC